MIFNLKTEIDEKAQIQIQLQNDLENLAKKSSNKPDEELKARLH